MKCCVVGWLLWLLAPVGWAGEDPPCRHLAALQVDELATLQFERLSFVTESLPAGARYRLGNVTIVRQDVFEQPENWLHRAANRFHPRTRERVIRSVLPMGEGDRVDARLLAEAERILRAKPYLYDARVIPERLCGDVLDLLVVTRDVWTLDPRLSFDRSGGENDVGFGLSDSNVFGSGKTLSVGFEKDDQRSGVTLYVSDPNIAHSRWSAEAQLVENDDGERYAAALRYPFYALDTRHAFLLSGDSFVRDEGLYFLSDKLWEYRADSQLMRVAGGWSRGLDGRHVNRVLAGFAFEDYAFDLPAAFLAAFPDARLPERRFAYPYLAFQQIEDDFHTRRNLDRVQRTEDIALGRRLYAELGYASDALGSSGEHLVARISLADASWLTRDQLLTWSASAGGYYDLDDHTGENVTVSAEAAYRWRHGDAFSLLVRGSATVTRNRTLDQQLLLGGDTGLRGYPNRYQTGDRRLLLTVEERYYSSIYPFRMFRLGGAVFFDAGRAWYRSEPPAWEPAGRGEDHFGLLSNVGFGLRLESTRTRGDRVLHLDVAFPLQDGPDVGTEITFTARQSL